MKVSLLALALCCLAQAGAAQDLNYFMDDITDYKHAITIEPLNLLLKTISVSYIVSISDKTELRINPKVSFPFSKDNRLFEHSGSARDPIEDPFWYYTAYTLQMGFSRKLGAQFYVEPMFFSKYASFTDRELQTKDSKADSYDEFETLDRRYYGTGFILRFGTKKDNRDFRFNFFWGVGFNVRSYEEDVKSRRTYSGIVDNIYDPEPNYTKAKLSVHIGIEIGPRF